MGAAPIAAPMKIAVPMSTERIMVHQLPVSQTIGCGSPDYRLGDVSLVAVTVRRVFRRKYQKCPAVSSYRK